MVGNARRVVNQSLARLPARATVNLDVLEQVVACAGEPGAASETAGFQRCSVTVQLIDDEVAHFSRNDPQCGDATGMGPTQR